MNKIYLGETEVSNIGGGGVSDASFDELAKVAATALLDLKQTTNDLKVFDDDIDTRVLTLESKPSGITHAQLDASLKAYTYDKTFIDASVNHIDVSIKALDASALAFDASIKELVASGSGISLDDLDASLKAYTYDKTFIDASFGDVDNAISNISDDIESLDTNKIDKTDVYTKSWIDASIHLIDVSINALEAGSGGGGGITPQQLDASLKAYTYDKTFIDASIHQLDVSINALEQGGGGGFDPTNINASINDISTRVRTIENDYVVDDDISTFKPIVYTTKDEYDEDVSEGTIDPDTMYVITDIASSDELSNIVTIDDLNAEKARINASLNDSGDEVITAANSSMNYWKTTNVSQCQSQCTTAKNTAVSAVQSQQMTSVNAVNTAKNSAISEIDTKMAEMKTFEVMTEAEYAEITPDANTIYFITD